MFLLNKYRYTCTRNKWNTCFNDYKYNLFRATKMLNLTPGNTYFSVTMYEQVVGSECSSENFLAYR